MSGYDNVLNELEDTEDLFYDDWESSGGGGSLPPDEDVSTASKLSISADKRAAQNLRSIIVKSAVREQLEGMNVSSDFYDALEREVTEMVLTAAQRAHDNGRKTVQARDV